MSSVLVIGGTTFFGKAIVEHLLKDGHNVTIFSRGQQLPAFMGQVTHVKGDRNNDDDFAQLKAHSFDAVIDNIAYTAEDVRQALDSFKGNIRRYIFTSSAASYYTASMTMPLKECDVDFSFKPPEEEKDSPLWTYTMGKLEGEHILFHQDDVPFTIIRPPIVLGPEDVTLRGYFYFQRLMDGKPLILSNGGVQSFRLAYSQDLAKGYLLAMNSEQAAGQAYNIAQGEVVTLKNMVDLSAEALGVEANIVNIPSDVFTQTEFEYPETYGPMINFMLDNSKAEQELGYTHTPFKDWISETVLWYRDEYQGKDSPGYEQRDREVKFAKWFQKSTRSWK